MPVANSRTQSAFAPSTYNDYRNFEAVIVKARTACFNSGHRLEDHFVDITEMIGIGKGGQRPVKTVMMSRYACYLVIQNADPEKEIVALGQTYFTVQTRRQELSDNEIEEQRRLTIRSELRTHNSQLADAAKGPVSSSRATTQFSRITATWASTEDSVRKISIRVRA